MPTSPTLVGAPLCAHRPECPGCPLLELSYTTTVARKRELLEASALHGELIAASLDTIEAHGAQPHTAWRARARMVVHAEAARDEELLGFYAQGTRQLLPILTCQAHRPPIERALAALRPRLFSSDTLREAIAFVEARSTHGDAVWMTWCARGAVDDALVADAMQLALSLCEELPELSVALRLGGKAQAIGSGALYQLAGEAEERYTLRNGRALSLTPGGFFQQHPGQLEQAHALMLDWLGEPPTAVIDLYCGVGAHALALLAPGGRMLGVDIDGAAVEAARRNLAAANLEGEVLASSDEAAWEWLDARRTGDEVVVVNPARAGLHWRAVAWLAATQPERVLYMSCDPITLRRDLARLARVGLVATRAAALDMMPHTEHVEALVMLQRVELEPIVDLTPRQGAYAYGADVGPRAWSDGVSGVTAQGQEARWWAVVAGRAPRRGELPQRRGGTARIACERIYTDGKMSLLSIESSGLERDEELRERLRAWGHPVLGDPRFGDRRANHGASRHMMLDRMLLHCEEVVTPQGYQRITPLDEDWPLDVLERQQG